ncbi:hypothetical protein GYA25_02045 [Candidatus Woesearchaeota archaeon]|nr:hypothetical protein [Candidatus Woesearchaeota archaeon]
MKKVIEIGFDGLNRCGKDTQIALFLNYLSKKNYPYIMARGDGTRSGNDPLYPPSIWWEENRANLMDVNSENYSYKLNLSYQRLCREALIFKRRLENISSTSYLIFNRSILSRYFSLKQYDPDISLEEALISFNPKNKNLIPPIYPDLTLVLDVPKEELLRRLENSIIPETQRYDLIKFRINKYYSLYKQILEELKKNEKVKVFDGKKNPVELNKEIISFLNL